MPPTQGVIHAPPVYSYATLAHAGGIAVYDPFNVIDAAQNTFCRRKSFVSYDSSHIDGINTS
jgi:hypothetical protein